MARISKARAGGRYSLRNTDLVMSGAETETRPPDRQRKYPIEADFRGIRGRWEISGLLELCWPRTNRPADPRHIKRIERDHVADGAAIVGGNGAAIVGGNGGKLALRVDDDD